MEDINTSDQNQAEIPAETDQKTQEEEEKGPHYITDLFQCLVGLSTHMVEKDIIKLFKKSTTSKD